jgi:hypothetical protein
MTRRPYPEDFDFAWIASDRVGHIAAFVTAGSGPIPTMLLDSERLPVEDSEERVATLDVVTWAQLLVELKYPDNFAYLAHRGLFVYDWSDVHRAGRDKLHAYELIGVPGTPITTEALPPTIAVLLAEPPLDVTFGDERLIDVRKHHICCEPHRCE